MMERSAEVAIDDAARDPDDEDAIERAMSAARAGEEAREDEMRALVVWVHHLERLDTLLYRAHRTLGRI